MAIHKQTGWVVFLDVFGFRAKVESGISNDEILRLLEASHNESNQFTRQINPVPRKFSFSDSICYFYRVKNLETKYEILEKCFLDIKRILTIFTDNSLPLRGGIAFGPVAWSNNILVGAAAIRAYDYEQKTPVPLVLLPSTECTSIGYPSQDINAPHPRNIELKNQELVKGIYIYPDETYEYSKFVDRMYSTHLIHGPQKVERQWKEAKILLDQYKKELENDITKDDH